MLCFFFCSFERSSQSPIYSFSPFFVSRILRSRLVRGCTLRRLIRLKFTRRNFWMVPNVSHQNIFVLFLPHCGRFLSYLFIKHKCSFSFGVPVVVHERTNSLCQTTQNVGRPQAKSRSSNISVCGSSTRKDGAKSTRYRTNNIRKQPQQQHQYRWATTGSTQFGFLKLCIADSSIHSPRHSHGFVGIDSVPLARKNYQIGCCHCSRRVDGNVRGCSCRWVYSNYGSRSCKSQLQCQCHLCVV